MASITSRGIGSGLDVDAIVKKLMVIEQQPLDKLKDQATTVQSKLSSFGLLQSYMGNLRDIADKLAKPAFWTTTTATSSDASIQVSSTATATKGSYSVEVSQLASAQSLASPPYADSSAQVGTGKLTVQTGSWNADNTVFTADPTKPPVDIGVPLGEGSMESIKNKINAANAGVTASIVRDAAGARLVVRSLSTGVESAVKISVTDDPGGGSGGRSGLSALAFDPPNGGGMTESVKAKDTLAKINGLDVRSKNTTFTGVIDGVTLNVGKVTTSPAIVNVDLDTASQTQAISDFAKAFSDINAYIASQTKYDPATKKAAALQGDRATLTLQSNVRSMVTSTSSASSTFSRLNDIGVEVQKDGSVTVNSARLATAMQKPGEVGKLFSSTNTGDNGGNGIAVRASNMAKSMLATDGAITTRTKGLRDSINRNADDQDKLAARISLTEDRLNKQYTSLDTLMSGITGTNTSLTQSLTALSNLSKSLYSS